MVNTSNIKKSPKYKKAKIIAICNQKGGVGKTTSTINLGASLAMYGCRVLLIDLDPQSALSAGLGIPIYKFVFTVQNLLIDPTVSISDVIINTCISGMDIVPSNVDLSTVDIELVNKTNREYLLSKSLDLVYSHYDFILIDCQPSLGLLTINGLACADSVIIPTECEYFALRGLASLTDTVNKFHSQINPKLTINGILITRYNPCTVNARDIMFDIVEYFGNLVFKTIVLKTIKFPETSLAGKPIIKIEPKSGGAIAYKLLANEVLERFII